MSNIGKPYQKIAGKSLVEINVDKARQFKQIKKIILVYNKKDSKRVKSLRLKNIKMILGGKTRQESTFNALKRFVVLTITCINASFETSKIMCKMIRFSFFAEVLKAYVSYCTVSTNQFLFRVHIRCYLALWLFL